MLPDNLVHAHEALCLALESAPPPEEARALMLAYAARCEAIGAGDTAAAWRREARRIGGWLYPSFTRARKRPGASGA